VMFGHLFVTALHMLGASWAWAANAWSAAGGAIAVGLAVALAHELMPEDKPIDEPTRWLTAIATGLLAGFGPVALRDATLAEVQSWHAAWVVAAAWLALRLWRLAPDDSTRPRGALAWGLLCGAGLAHHRTSVLFSVPLSIAIARHWVREGAWRPALAARALAGLALPLAAWGSIAWRAAHPVAFQWPVLEPNAASIARYLGASAYTFYFGQSQPSPPELRLILRTLLPVMVPGLVLLAALAKAGPERDRGWRSALLACAALQIAFTLGYGVPDPSSFYRPAVMVAILAVPVVVAALPAPTAATAGAMALCLLALAPVPAALREARVARESAVRTETEIRARFERLPVGAIVVWLDDRFTMLRAFQVLEGRRRDVRVENPTMLTWPPPREAFRRDVGFDPLDGLELRAPDDIALIPGNIQRQTPRPVIDFKWFAP